MVSFYFIFFHLPIFEVESLQFKLSSSHTIGKKSSVLQNVQFFHRGKGKVRGRAFLHLPSHHLFVFVFFLLNMSNMLMEQTELSKHNALSCGLLCDGAAQRRFEFEAPDLWFDRLTLVSAKKIQQVLV